jgi:hypothetical protein
METFFISILLAIPLLGMFAGILLMREYLLRQAHRRRIENHNALHRFNPDQNGNFPAFFDARSGTFFAPPPGNSAFPAQVIMYNGQAKPLKDERVVMINPPRPLPVDDQPAERPAQVDDLLPGSAAQVDDLPPAQLPSPERRKLEIGELFSPERDINANMAVLAELKEKGIGQQEAISAVLGVASRSGALYRTYAAMWKKLDGAAPITEL